MKVYISAGHYHVHIDESKEFSSLISNPLEAMLQREDGSQLDKKLTLEYSIDAKQPAVNLLPPDCAWDKLKEIQVTLDNNSYEFLLSQGHSSIRFGSSQSIDFNLEQNLDGFI